MGSQSEPTGWDQKAHSYAWMPLQEALNPSELNKKRSPWPWGGCGVQLGLLGAIHAHWGKQRGVVGFGGCQRPSGFGLSVLHPEAVTL